MAQSEVPKAGANGSARSRCIALVGPYLSGKTTLLEAILARQPDVLVVPVEPGGHLAAFAGQAGWKDLEAVRVGRVVGVDADLFTRPGPRLPEAARTLQRALGEISPR